LYIWSSSKKAAPTRTCETQQKTPPLKSISRNTLNHNNNNLPYPLLPPAGEGRDEGGARCPNVNGEVFMRTRCAQLLWLLITSGLTAMATDKNNTSILPPDYNSAPITTVVHNPAGQTPAAGIYYIDPSMAQGQYAGQMPWPTSFQLPQYGTYASDPYGHPIYTTVQPRQLVYDQGTPGWSSQEFSDDYGVVTQDQTYQSSPQSFPEKAESSGCCSSDCGCCQIQ